MTAKVYIVKDKNSLYQHSRVHVIKGLSMGDGPTGEGSSRMEILAAALAAVTAMQAPTDNKDAYDLFKAGRVASLGTSDDGVPYVSMTPYDFDDKGRPFVYISDIAHHTKNLKNKADCSLMVFKEDKNPFASERITLIGKMTQVTDKDELKKLKKSYVKKFEDAEAFDELHDFCIFRMEVTKVHYIGGFGDIRWLKDWYKNWK